MKFCFASKSTFNLVFSTIYLQAYNQWRAASQTITESNFKIKLKPRRILNAEMATRIRTD